MFLVALFQIVRIYSRNRLDWHKSLVFLAHVTRHLRWSSRCWCLNSIIEVVSFSRGVLYTCIDSWFLSHLLLDHRYLLCTFWFAPCWIKQPVVSVGASALCHGSCPDIDRWWNCFLLTDAVVKYLPLLCSFSSVNNSLFEIQHAFVLIQTWIYSSLLVLWSGNAS